MEIQEKVSLKELTTFKIGGEAKFFCLAETLEDLNEAQEFALKKNLNMTVLGGGSNVLFSDGGFDGIVIKVKNEELSIKKENPNVIKCGAGVNLSKLVAFSLENGLTGLEWAIGIPGSVGGAVRGNAGAFSFKMEGNISKIYAVDFFSKEKNELILMSKNDCEFSYKDSIFKRAKEYLVWGCEFELEKGNAEESKKRIAEFTEKRNQIQSSLDKYPSAGSIFKNPVVSDEVLAKFERDKELKCKEKKVPAGWLIERCDLKGEQVGDAMVDPKHANFIVNKGNATAEDVLILVSLVKMKVRNKFGVQLEEEVQVIV